MRIEQLTSLRAKDAVNSVSLPVRQGEVLGLIGPSGCGKTTLLRSLNRLTELTPTATRNGRITLDEDDVDGLEETQLRRRVGMVFQQPNPFPMSIFDNVAYGLRESGGAAALEGPCGRRSTKRSSVPACTTRSKTTSTTPRSASPAASSSGSASPARSRSSRRCCCSTSRAQRSIPAPPRPSRS